MRLFPPNYHTTYIYINDLSGPCASVTPIVSRPCILIGPGRLSLDFAFQSAPIYSHIATAWEVEHGAGQPIVSCVQPNLKVVLVLSEKASKLNIVYGSCMKRLQMPSLIACDY